LRKGKSYYNDELAVFFSGFDLLNMIGNSLVRGPLSWLKKMLRTFFFMKEEKKVICFNFEDLIKPLLKQVALREFFKRNKRNDCDPI